MDVDNRDVAETTAQPELCLVRRHHHDVDAPTGRLIHGTLQGSVPRESDDQRIPSSIFLNAFPEQAIGCSHCIVRIGAG